MTTVLVVEDSATIRMVVVSTLKKRSFTVVEAEDGLEARQLAFQQNFDLVITDLHMPNMNGIELTKCLRENRSYLNTPIIMMSTDDSRRPEALEAGVNTWLTKPIDTTTLMRTVLSYIS